MGFLSTAHYVHIALAYIDFYLLFTLNNPTYLTTQLSYLSYKEMTNLFR